MARRKLPVILLLGALWGTAAPGEPLGGSLPAGVSTAHFYDAASVFTNPAALGFQTDLNGVTFGSALYGAFARSADEAFSTAFSLGYLGFGYERLVETAGRYNRYHFALGVPFHPTVFLGFRYSLTRRFSLGDHDSADVGLQVRPSRYFAVSLMANGLNEPTVGGAPLPIQYVAGLVVRPLPPLQLTLDVDTPGDRFFETFGYQATLGYELLRGFQVQGGYHDRYGVQVGLRFDLGQTSLYATSQPDSRDRTFVLGLNSTALLRPSLLEPPKAVRIHLDATLQEEPVEGSFFLPDRPSLWQKLAALDRAAVDPNVELIIVRVEDFPLGLASAMELSRKLFFLRERGKRVEAYLGNSGLREYLVAAPAQKIYLAPGSQLDFTGPRSSTLYLTGTLGKLGVEAEIFARGKYKTAPEAFTRREASPAAREVTFELLRQADELISDWLAKTGRVPKNRWKEALDNALFSAGEAKQFGLVDDIAPYRIQETRLRRQYAVTESLTPYRNRLNLPSRVAVVHGDGAILESRGPLALGAGALMTPEAMKRKFDRAVNDPLTEAIVFRVSSGGGEVAASYEIGALVEEARKKKPVVVSMGDIAASGGYLVAAPADRIFADPATLTGSIGVFTGKPNLKGLFDKIALNQQILSLAPHADLLAWDRPFTPEGRKIMQRQLDNYYEGFTTYVANRRKLSAEKVETAAQGRVWSGFRAKELGLVDETGGLSEAIRFAAHKADLGEDFEVTEVAKTRGLLDFFETGSVPLLSAEGLLPADVRESLLWMASLRNNPFLLLAPVKPLE